MADSQHECKRVKQAANWTRCRPRRNPVRFPCSHNIPTSIPTQFLCTEISGTGSDKMRRAWRSDDGHGVGEASRPQAETSDAGCASDVSRRILHNTKMVSVSTSRSARCQHLPVAMIVANGEEALRSWLKKGAGDPAAGASRSRAARPGVAAAQLPRVTGTY